MLAQCAWTIHTGHTEVNVVSNGPMVTVTPHNPHTTPRSTPTTKRHVMLRDEMMSAHHTSHGHTRCGPEFIRDLAAPRPHPPHTHPHTPQVTTCNPLPVLQELVEVGAPVSRTSPAAPARRCSLHKSCSYVLPCHDVMLRTTFKHNQSKTIISISLTRTNLRDVHVFGQTPKM